MADEMMTMMKLILNKVTDLSDQIDKMDERLDKIEIRLDKMDERFDQMELRLDKVEERLDQIELRLDRMDERLDQMELRLDKMDVRFDQMDLRFDYVSDQSNQMKDRSREMGLYIENVINVKTGALFDAYSISQTYFIEENRIKRIEDTVVLHGSVIQKHSEKLNQLCM